MTIRINALPEATNPAASSFLAVDGATTEKATLQKVVDAGAPVASQAEAEAGADNAKRMTALRTKQYVDAQIGNTIASAASGALANTALQPGEAATPAQGALAGTAVQPGDLGDSASLNVGTTAGTVAAGDDSRIVNALQPVASISSLKALSAIAGKTISLIASGREGVFAFRSGDYSAEISADTENALYVKADAIAATSGAWVRQSGWMVDGIDIAWAGGNAQAAATLAGALGIKTVKGSGTITLTSTLSVPANITLYGSNRALNLIQGNGANLSELITLADGASIRECEIDGNRANNTDNTAYVTVRIGNSNDCVVELNTIKNCTGNGVGLNNGSRAKVRKNIFTNFHDYAISVYGSDGEYHHDISSNFASQIGHGLIVLSHANHNDVIGNTAIGQVIGGRLSRTTVNTSGTTITWVSGENFSSVIPGNFLVINNGQEFRVLSKTSDTVLVAESALPTLSGVQASVGSGDLIGVVSSNYNKIHDNTLDRTATFLFGFSLSGVSTQCGNNSFMGNTLNFAGKNAINLNGAVGLGSIENNSILSNKIFNAGWAGGIGPTDAIAIFAAAGQTGGTPNVNVNGTIIDDNTVISFAGSGQTTYWFGTDANLAYGSISIGNNQAEGVANGTAIFNDIVAISLGAGWGTTASVSSQISYGNKIKIIINSTGSGFAANPNFTVFKICDGFETPPWPVAKIVSGSAFNYMFGEQSSTRGNWTASMQGTPSSGNAFEMVIKA